ncbi:MAG: hypothetical protein EPN84_01460 [Legionella sp.]|nr:MAG: hypothetical protein EPN84_01460 [Legionella sp.]
MKTIKKILLGFVAVFVPWVLLLINDNPGGAFVALIMQASVIGWPFATVWAWKVATQSPIKGKKRTENP